MSSTEKKENDSRPIRARLKFRGTRIEHWTCESRQQLSEALAENYQATGCMPISIELQNEHRMIFVLPILRTGNPAAELFIAQQEKAIRREEFEQARHRLMAATRRVNDLQAQIHFTGKGGQQ